jgi:uncharacterized protein (DUF697 family)
MRLNKQIEEEIRFLVLIDGDAPEPLLDAAKENLRPRTATGKVDVEVCEEGFVIEPAPHTDAVIVLAGSGMPSCVSSIAAAHRQVTPVVVLALREELQGLDYRLGQPREDLLFGSDPAELCGARLGKWLADRLVTKRLPLAYNFDFARPAVASQLTTATAWQNALIGAVTILPGADMPLMTANQAKLLLQIAAAYGQPIGAGSRLGELAAVVGGGYALRTVARQALTFVPGFGWLVKGGIGFSGTVAMGKAAQAYFEEGADITEMVQDLVTKLTDRDEDPATIESDAMVVDAQAELPLADGQPARADATG